MRYRYVFGPVRSRRLGVSLGVNNIPYKVCSYTCIYCQLGRTIRLSTERRRYSDPDRVVAEVADALEKAGSVDYVTFVPDGEPTLDLSLGEEIERIEGELSAKVAVLTNSSLLWREDVQRDLAGASYVSLKVDAATSQVWRRVDRPHPMLSFEQVVEGLLGFSRKYSGTIEITTETMLVRGVNDEPSELERIADLVARIEPSKAYLAVPTRPPAEPWVEPPPAERLVEAYEAFRSRGLRVELLASSEPPPPPPGPAGGDPVEAVYRTLAVHPLPVEVVEKLFREAGVDPSGAIKTLEGRGDVVRVKYRGRVFLARRPLPRR